MGNLSTDQSMNIGKIIQENQDLNMFQKMMQCMEEAILVIKDQSIEFSNHVYDKMISRANVPIITKNDLNTKFIRIH